MTRFFKTVSNPIKNRVISFLLGSLVLVFPLFSNGPYVTSSRRYVTSLPTSREIRLVIGYLLAVGRVTTNLCYTWPPGTGGWPDHRVPGHIQVTRFQCWYVCLISLTWRRINVPVNKTYAEVVVELFVGWTSSLQRLGTRDDTLTSPSSQKSSLLFVDHVTPSSWKMQRLFLWATSPATRSATQTETYMKHTKHQSIISNQSDLHEMWQTYSHSIYCSFLANLSEFQSEIINIRVVIIHYMVVILWCLLLK